MLVLGIDVWYLVGVIVAWFIGTLLAYRFIFIPIVLPWIEKCLGNVIVRIFTTPTEVEKNALFGLLDIALEYATTREINTGKKIKTKVETDQTDTDGNPLFEVIEVDELVTPMVLVAQQIGGLMMMKFKGQAGGVKAQLGRVLQAEATESGSGLSPAAAGALLKGKFGPALAELGMPYLMKVLNKGPDNITKAGGGGELR